MDNPEPCPWCIDDTHEVRMMTHVREELWWEECSRCGATGPRKKSKGAALTAWNTRATPSQPPDVEAAVEALIRRADVYNQDVSLNVATAKDMLRVKYTQVLRSLCQPDTPPIGVEAPESCAKCRHSGKDPWTGRNTCFRGWVYCGDKIDKNCPSATPRERENIPPIGIAEAVEGIFHLGYNGYHVHHQKGDKMAALRKTRNKQSAEDKKAIRAILTSLLASKPDVVGALGEIKREVDSLNATKQFRWSMHALLDKAIAKTPSKPVKEEK